MNKRRDTKPGAAKEPAAPGRRFIGAATLGERLGVSRSAVNKWRKRYPVDSLHPFPEPDVEIDDVPGWAPERVPEIEQWRAGMPGSGNSLVQAD
ncbi:helix-turn-helix domain-containing protein [Amycolatopsis sp. CA-230715]|uniref:helix-turn-helix domain-containing protein n=1 Tax=Amycolatopsis sp. CA-230715 TaxID=2745196 RepID=UPI001C012768|nr:helix-turn-helix domain-containing protein [Amycolatopsis sp. CA-230715]QWF80139.1 hypothetical protein HUW46_03557 [Amycolatopsis sp. CA-230715]